MGLTIEQTQKNMHRLAWAMSSLPAGVQILHCQIDATRGPSIQIESGSGFHDESNCDTVERPGIVERSRVVFGVRVYEGRVV